jgi:subtilase family serine protease
MSGPRFLRAAMLGVVVAAVGLVSAPAAHAAPASAPSSHVHVCGAPAHGAASCNAIRNDAAPRAGRAATTNPGGLHPADLTAAYALPSATAGAGQTVAIVDAYDDPNAEADLGTYRSQFGLPACTTANGCFRKLNQTGGTSRPKANGGWAQEISLDLDMASAICPNCHILLVEANSASMTDLGTAVNTAVLKGATVVSNSYGGAESSSDLTYDTSYFKHTRVAITASSGDAGYGVEYPAASPYVTAVGGTALTKSTSARGWSETAWSSAGSGCSSIDAQPSWQAARTDITAVCRQRAVADVSAVADPNTGVAVYDSYRYQGTAGWLVFGGTSVSAPVVAGVYALAGNAASISNGSFPYAHATALHDVTSGSNGSCGATALCTAKTGWDGPTGLGTPNGVSAF